MMINISSGGPHDPRNVTVEDGDGVIASFEAANLAEVHKRLKQGLGEGWGEVPAAPSVEPKQAKPRKKAAR